MKIGRIVWLACLFWALIFVEVSMLMFMPGLGNIYWLQRIIHLILLAPITYLCVWLYYKKGNGNGFLLGFMLILIGSILDILITIPLFVKSFDFYKDVFLWLGFLEVILISGFFPRIRKLFE